MTTFDARAALARWWPSRRQANLLLLAATLLALATGTWLFATGGPAARPLAIAHGVVGLSLLPLGPRKRRTVTGGWGRERRTRWLSVLLLLAALVTVATGVGHAAGWRKIAAQPVMHVHVIAAIATGVLVIWHAVARPARIVRTDASRRSLLRGAVIGITAAATWTTAEDLGRLLGLPGSRRRGTGSFEVASFQPARMPATIWFRDRVPDLDRRGHTVTIGEARLTAADLGADRTWTATLDCTSGWYSTQRWGGAPVAEVLASPPPGARSIRVRSVTGYTRRFPLRDRERLLLATHLGGLPVTRRHGGPIRLVAPGRRGNWWVKWVAEVAYDPAPWWVQPPFPLT